MRTAMAVLMCCVAACAARAQRAAAGADAGVEAFNRAFADATRHMDNAATIALWAEDGVSLLPSRAPIRGRATIAAFLDSVTASFPGAHMEQFEMSCHDVHLSGDWASEWCTEHQVVRFADGRPPFDGWGKLLLVLHRAGDRQWRIRTEMWNQAVPDVERRGAPK